MASGTKIRTLARLLDASESTVWVISPQGKLIYLSAAVSRWLGIEAEQLVNRRSVAGAPISDDPLDFVAASLSPPPGFTERGTARLRVQPPPIDGRKILTQDVRFVRVGKTPNAATFAFAGDFDDQQIESVITTAQAIRQQLDGWRSRHAAVATIATAGSSRDARRLRSRLHVAASTRTHIGFFGPEGCGSESIARQIHARSAPDEPLSVVEGPLMDAELLDATMAASVNHLATAQTARATVLVRGLDEMPVEAGQRLAELLTTFSGRLRMLGLCGPSPVELDESLESDSPDAMGPIDQQRSSLLPRLVDFLSAFTVQIAPLSTRVVDIPVLAAAMVDSRHAAGEGPAERISRAALDAMIVYPWPRNFEELDEAMRHAVGAARTPSISKENLPLAIRSYHVVDPSKSTELSVSLDQATKQYEMSLINKALEATDGNRAEAARRLGISRARLLRKLDDGSEGASE